MARVLIVALLVFVPIAYLVHKQVYLCQYLFFCRYPILLGLTLCCVLPMLMVVWAEDSIGNLAVLEPLGVGSVAMLATMTAWVIMTVTVRMLYWIELVAALPFKRKNAGQFDSPFLGCIQKGGTKVAIWIHDRIRKVPKPGGMQLGRLMCYSLLALPIIVITVVKSSPKGGLDLLRNTLAAAMGIGCAVFIRVAGARLTVELFTLLRKCALVRRGSVRAEKQVKTFLKRRYELDDPDGLRPPSEKSLSEFVRSFGYGVGFFALALIIYVAGWTALHPDRAKPAPPLLIVLMLLLLLTFILSTFSGLCDKARVMVMVTLIALMCASFILFDIDHHYEVIVETKGIGELTPADAFRKWCKALPPDTHPVPVVVTASGGGITAAYWAAEVLTQLQREVPSFGHCLVAVSSVSGGGVGAMYFIGAYTDGQPPQDTKTLDKVKELAADSSLTATTWGLAYRDILWAIPGLNRTKDRGWALEQKWRGNLADTNATLRGWRNMTQEKWRPVQIFNATVAESGERFLMSPLSFSGAKDRDTGTEVPQNRRAPLNFLDFYGNADLHVATAARLSSTFPFVSPIARPEKDAVPEEDAYHLADGGYYDNHGIVTAVEFLQQILPEVVRQQKEANGPGTVGSPAEDKAVPVPDVLFVQIRVAGKKREPAKPEAGFKFATIGPITALLNVRTASQVERSAVEVGLLTRAWSNRVAISSLVFELAGVEAPLSWHLTEEDKREIDEGWNAQHKRLVAQVRKILEP